MGTRHPSRPEPITGPGAALLSVNHLALLHGLFDRPGMRAPSTADLLRAAVPYARLLGNWRGLPRLAGAARSLHPAWARPERVGRHVTWQLTVRGRQIVERMAPAYIRGAGPYGGLRPRGARRAQRPPSHDAVERRWLAVSADPALTQLVAAAEGLIAAWTKSTPAFGMAENLRRDYWRKGVAFFVRSYALKHGALPVGAHRLTVAEHGCDLRIDFDKLRNPG